MNLSAMSACLLSLYMSRPTTCVVNDHSRFVQTEAMHHCGGSVPTPVTQYLNVIIMVGRLNDQRLDELHSK